MCCQTHPADEFCFVQLWCIHHGSFGPIRPALFTGNSQSFTAEYNWNSAFFTKLARLHSLDVFLLMLHCCLAIALIALVFKAEPGHGACVCQSFHKSAQTLLGSACIALRRSAFIWASSLSILTSSSSMTVSLDVAAASVWPSAAAEAAARADSTCAFSSSFA